LFVIPEQPGIQTPALYFRLSGNGGTPKSGIHDAPGESVDVVHLRRSQPET
jgi:hypothetical protein